MPPPDGAPEQTPEPDQPPPAPVNQWLALLNLGWIFLATLGITVFGGLWLDKRFGTAPVFILIGVLLGFAASGYYFYQTVRKLGGGAPGKPQ